MTISVVVGTYGEDSWQTLAQQAVASAWQQSVAPLEVLHVHAETLDDARNQGAEAANGDWLIFLDADDELDGRYIEQMAAMIDRLRAGVDYLLQPATLGIHADGREDPNPILIPAKRSIMDGNWLVIGTAMRRSQFLRLGGFSPMPAWEDWHLFIRAMLDGARALPVPGAVYRVHVRQNSRNALDQPAAERLYRQVRDSFLPEARAKGLA
jgi:GT2 family glycosyltransferase